MRLPKLRSLLPVLSAAALCLALAACKSDEQKLAEFLDRGKQALDAEKYDEAVIESISKNCSLIALSLAANPAFVTLHHLLRILTTVAEMSLARRRGWF